MDSLDGKNDPLIDKTPVTTYQGIFKDVHNRYIFISGEPGTGKSTFCTKLSLDWCRTKNKTSNSTLNYDAFCDVSTLEKFEFVFLLWLNGSNTETLTNTLKTYFKKYTGIEFDTGFITNLLAVEPCLIIYDGNDEQINQKKSIIVGALPVGKTNEQSFILTTLRPWKLDDFKQFDPLPNQLFQIQGVSAEKQVKSMLDLLKQGERQLSEFLKFYKRYPYFNNIPLFTAALFCLWMDKRTPDFDNINILFINVIEMLIGRKHQAFSAGPLQDLNLPDIFKNCSGWKENFGLLKKLANLAFETLIQTKMHENNFSDILNQKFSDIEIAWTVSTGILLKRNIVTYTCQTSEYYFLHKTFQEFFCAFDIVYEKTDLNSILEKYDSNDIGIDLWQLFKFLCGFRFKDINSIGTFLMKRDILRFLRLPDSDSDEMYDIIEEHQDILLKGYKCYNESLTPTGHELVPLSTIYTYFCNEDDTAKTELARNSDFLQAIFIKGQSVFSPGLDTLKQHCEQVYIFGLRDLKYRLINAEDISPLQNMRSIKMLLIHNCSLLDSDNQQLDVIDMTSCQMIETLKIIDSNITVHINSTNLSTVILQRYDFCKMSDNFAGNNLLSSFAKSTNLKTLCLYNCKTNNVYENEEETEAVDLTKCTYLDNLDIRNTDIVMNICATQLTVCNLKRYNLSKGNVVEALQQSQTLKELYFDKCVIDHLHQYNKKIPFLDFSNCTKLDDLFIRHTESAWISVAKHLLHAVLKIMICRRVIFLTFYNN